MAPIFKRNASSSSRGYDGVKLRDQHALRKYQCPLCKHLIRNPIQTDRGELACEYCYTEETRIQGDGKCPIDGEALGQTFRDKRKELDILDLECFCYYDGCTWNGQLRDLEVHLEECKYSPISCPLCENLIPSTKQDEHIEECPGILRDGCLYIGCEYRPETIGELKNHLNNNALHHAYLHKTSIIDLQEKVEKNENLIKEKEKIHRTELDEMKLQIDNMSKMFETMLQNQEDDHRIKNHEERIEQLEVKQFKEPNHQNNSNDKTPNQDKEVQSLSNQVTLLSKTIADTDLRLQLHENTSYDGKLLWKIDNIKTRLTQAVTGKASALHSAPTFTERFGYKYCARLYLNGDGIGRSKYVSLFFVLMKSEYDTLQDWPFREHVSFKLINQEDRKKDLTESFIPDRISSSYAKPKKEMNVASGCPQFIELSKFKNDGYVKEDCIYIEISVGTPQSQVRDR